MEEDEIKKISKHHGSVSVIIRLDILWRDTHRHSRNGEFAKWNSDLDRVWCELARDLDEDDFKVKKSKFDSFDAQILELGEFNDSKPLGFKEPSKGEINKRGKHYKVLMGKELFLRRLENELGKGTEYEDEDEYDMD